MSYKLSKPKLDWLTFSLPAERFEPNVKDSFDAQLFEWAGALAKRYPELADLDNETGTAWRYGGSVRPYPLSLENTETGARIGFGGQHDQCTVWLSGGACQELRAQGLEPGFLAWLADKDLSVSRIDIAVDFDTPHGINTLAAIIAGKQAKAQTQNMQRSKTGETISFGSRKSARYVRLYRYTDNPLRPFPRLEIELKGKSAKAALWKINNFGVERVFETLVKKAGLNLDIGLNQGLLPVLDLERKSKPTAASKLAWLRNQVAPAIRSMVEQDMISKVDLWRLFFNE